MSNCLFVFIQLSFIQHSLMSPEVFCFADYPCHNVATDILKAPPEDDNREIATWYVSLSLTAVQKGAAHICFSVSVALYCVWPSVTNCSQEKSGPGWEPAQAVGGGPVRAGEAVVQLPNQTLPRHVGVGITADLHLLAHTAPWAHLDPNAHLSGQPPQLCHYPALRLAWTGWCWSPSFCWYELISTQEVIFFFFLWHLGYLLIVLCFFLCLCTFLGTVSIHPSVNNAFDGWVVHERGAVWPSQAVSHPGRGPGLEGLFE